MNAVEAAAKAGREANLAGELDALFTTHNKAERGTAIPATFLRVTVSV
jgi:hypothetical protein